MVSLLLSLVLQCPDGAPPPCRGALPRAPQANSVAVLYFDNRSADSSDAYLADGLTEEVISRLASVERLSVASRHLVRRYRGTEPDPAAVARSLNVAYLVTGSIRRAGGRLRVSAELVQAGGRQVWGRQFDQTGSDVFVIQEAVAREVAGGIIGRLIPSEQRAIAARPTANPAAHDAVLRGNYFLARRDSIGFARAIEEYQRALAVDSGYVAALAGLSLAYGLSEVNGFPLGLPTDTVVARAMRYAGQAVRRDSAASDAWMALGIAQSAATPRDLTRAIATLERAVQLDPANAEALAQLGGLLTNFVSADSGSTLLRRALAIQPRRPITLVNFAELAIRQGRWRESLAWVDSALRFEPDFAAAHALKALDFLLLDDTAALRRELATWQTIPSLREPSAWITTLLGLRGADSSALARFRREALEPIPTASMPAVTGAYIAMLMLKALNDRDGALLMLERTQRGAALAVMMRGVLLSQLAGEARYQQVLRESSP